MPVVTLAYRKDTLWPAGHGYGRQHHGEWVANRPGLLASLVIHSTNGNAGSSFAAECAFLRDSPDVSAHDVIGKDGTIASILPDTAIAWHAGACLPAFNNWVSYGIELAHAIGEEYTAAQIDALTWRVQQLIAAHHIPKPLIDTHRAIALPRGRKVDPSDWPDADFYAWRDLLYSAAPVAHAKLVYLRTTAAANIRQGPARSFPVVLTLPVGTAAAYDAVPTLGEDIGGNNRWMHRVDGLGFCHSSLLEVA